MNAPHNNSRGPQLAVVAPEVPVPPGLAQRAANAALATPRVRPPFWVNVVPLGMLTAAAAVAASAVLWLGTGGVARSAGTSGVASWEAWPDQMLASTSNDVRSRWTVEGGTP